MLVCQNSMPEFLLPYATIIIIAMSLFVDAFAFTVLFFIMCVWIWMCIFYYFKVCDVSFVSYNVRDWELSCYYVFQVPNFTKERLLLSYSFSEPNKSSVWRPCKSMLLFVQLMSNNSESDNYVCRFKKEQTLPIDFGSLNNSFKFNWLVLIMRH